MPRTSVMRSRKGVVRVRNASPSTSPPGRARDPPRWRARAPGWRSRRRTAPRGQRIVLSDPLVESMVGPLGYILSALFEKERLGTRSTYVTPLLELGPSRAGGSNPSGSPSSSQTRSRQLKPVASRQMTLASWRGSPTRWSTQVGTLRRRPSGRRGPWYRTSCHTTLPVLLLTRTTADCSPTMWSILFWPS